MKINDDTAKNARQVALKAIQTMDVSFGRIHVDGFEFVIQNGKIHNVVQEIEFMVDGKKIHITKRHSPN